MWLNLVENFTSYRNFDSFCLSFTNNTICLFWHAVKKKWTTGYTQELTKKIWFVYFLRHLVNSCVNLVFSSKTGFTQELTKIKKKSTKFDETGVIRKNHFQKNANHDSCYQNAWIRDLLHTFKSAYLHALWFKFMATPDQHVYCAICM